MPPVSIEVENNNINIKCENSEFNIAGNPGEDYPDLPLVVEKIPLNYLWIYLKELFDKLYLQLLKTRRDLH